MELIEKPAAAAGHVRRRAAFRHILPEKPQAGVFSAAVLLRLLCPRRALLDAVSAAVRSTPGVYVSEFGWVASVIFSADITQATLAGADEHSFRCRRAWLAPAFGVPLLAFYCTFGDISPTWSGAA